MTIVYKGIRRKTTDVLDDYGQAHYLQNVRLKRVGEMGRRAGLGKSTMAQLAGPVQFMIGAWSNEPFIVNGTGGDVTGTADPLPLWTAATLRIGEGVVGEGTPVAPSITTLVSVPSAGLFGPPPYPTFVITPIIVYDGLSGPLIYLWEIINDTGANATIVDPTASVCTVNTAASTPGTFSVQLTITASFNPAFTDQAGTGTYIFIP